VTGAFIDEFSLAALMPGERMSRLAERYRATPVAAASDRRPTAYRYSLVVAGRADSGPMARLLSKVMDLTWWPFVLGVGLLGLLVMGLLRRCDQGPALLTVFSVGFSGMGATVLILVVAQATVGALHHLLGALLAAHMAGLALAGWTPWPRPRLVIALGLGLVAPGAIPWLSRFGSYGPAAVTVGALLVAALVAGMAGGIGFRSAIGEGMRPARAYGGDLLGAALAAPAIAVFVLPRLGLDVTCGVLAFFLAPAALVLALRLPRQSV